MTETYEIEIRCSNCMIFLFHHIPKGQTISSYKNKVICHNCGCEI